MLELMAWESTGHGHTYKEQMYREISTVEQTELIMVNVYGVPKEMFNM